MIVNQQVLGSKKTVVLCYSYIAQKPVTFIFIFINKNSF